MVGVLNYSHDIICSCFVTNKLPGTVVAMETKPGILKASQTLLIEGLRDTLERDFTEYLAKPNI